MTATNIDWPAPFPEAVARRVAKSFSLAPDWTFLNHGSFGATLTAAQRRQQALRTELERQPVHFFMRRYLELLDASRSRLAEFVRAEPADLAFVPNATTGVSTVLRSLDFAPGDEILTTGHDYNACRQALSFVAEKTGAVLRVAALPFPPKSADEIVDAVARAMTPRTRIALLDHVTSATALVMPVARLVELCKERGALSLVDGAHAPGMVEVDLSTIAPSFYTANCHKWLCAPKGSGFLYVDASLRARIRPLTVSHGATQGLVGRSAFHQEFDWTGTRDASPELCVGTAIDTLESLLPGGIRELREHNRAMVLAGRELLAEVLGCQAALPLPEMVGSIATLELPDRAPTSPQGYVPGDALYRRLIAEKIEVPIFSWSAASGEAPKRLLRISAQAYNVREHYERLAQVLARELSAGAAEQA